MDPEIDSYSGFYDNGHKKSTGLSGLFKRKRCNDLYFCGLAADICVYFSFIDALKEGFKATLIEDAAVPLLPKEFREKSRRDIKYKGEK